MVNVKLFSINLYLFLYFLLARIYFLHLNKLIYEFTISYEASNFS